MSVPGGLPFAPGQEQAVSSFEQPPFDARHDAGHVSVVKRRHDHAGHPCGPGPQAPGERVGAVAHLPD
jgi:hypothetical protein